MCPVCHSKLLLGRVPAECPAEECLCCGLPVSQVSKKARFCKSCNAFTLCKNCNLCQKAHNIKKVFSLLRKDGTHYLGNHRCDLCKKSSFPIGFKGSLHCVVCEFDVCPDCEAERVQ